MLADPQPTYELYTNLNNEELAALKAEKIDFTSETGTLYISEAMMKKMNPLSLLLKLSIAYNQPVVSTMDLTMGGYLSYSIYKPGYVALPKKVEQAAIINGLTQTPQVHVNFEKKPINSFFMNNLDFGISLGLLFKV